MEETAAPAAKKGGPNKQAGMRISESPWRAIPMKKTGTSMKGAPKSMKKMANGHGMRLLGRLSGRSTTSVG
jgi:hypothetical protein